MRALTLFLALTTLPAVATEAALPFSVSLESEAPGAHTSTSGFDAVGVESFDTWLTGDNQTFVTGFNSGRQV